MAAMWEKLVILLNHTLQIYQALLQLSRKKREILVEAKPQELELLTKQEERFIIEAGKLEKLRLSTIQELAAALGIAPERAVLSELVEHADSDTAAELKKIGQQFSGLAGELTQLNELNEKLIQQSLEFVNYNINVLSQATAESTYAPKGQPETTRPGRSLLDTKV
ncbi:hypothetical protein SRRS_39890 [Sporomusa rhizae]